MRTPSPRFARSPARVRGALRLPLAGMAAVLLTPQPLWAQLVQSPAPGVLCDPLGLRGSGVCYDAKGASLPLTGRWLGRRAETQLRAYLAANPAPQEFRLSNGTVCSVSERTCWEDGWSKRNVSQRLTRQLFSGPSTGSDSTGSTPPSSGKETGLCSLSRGSQAVFDGRCELSQIDRGDGLTRYRVRLANGTAYAFTNRNGTVTIADDFGSTWPVSYVNHGVTGIFRWGDMSLVATQTAGSARGASPDAASGGSENLGRAVGTLLNTLFR